MCGSKMKTDATEPSGTPRSSRHPKSSPSEASRRSSTTDTSTSNIISANYTTGSIYSPRTSISSKTSLFSLRESLPGNHYIYDFSEIRAATNNFFAKRLSSSATWRCSIRGKDVVLFQRRFRRSIEASRLRERLSLICRSHHVSLISFLGASISSDHIYLIYDYVNGANLAECLRNPKNPKFTVLSTWLSRMRVATDLAQGLDYIHNSIGLNQNLVHNHIKSTNVIVTEPSFHAKICHFGTAELCGEIPEDHQNERSGEITTSPKLKRLESRMMKFEGTRGYMSPEYRSTGVATQKSDVFAFGVVILELLSGEEPLKYRLDMKEGDFMRASVIETAREAMTESSSGGGGGGGGEEEDGAKLRKWIDRRLNDSYPIDVAKRMTGVALECVQVDPDERPDMRVVASKISKLYLKSVNWSEKLKLPTDFTVSLAPR